MYEGEKIRESDREDNNDNTHLLELLGLYSVMRDLYMFEVSTIVSAFRNSWAQNNGSVARHAEQFLGQPHTVSWTDLLHRDVSWVTLVFPYGSN